ncbi:hypothetical protein CPB85DRAFT_1459483 [Mucidula mucida]|nr:hypothetical protein CPB85DRAFT_1459483 [Mucidula mucida]
MPGTSSQAFDLSARPAFSIPTNCGFTFTAPKPSPPVLQAAAPAPYSQSIDFHAPMASQSSLYCDNALVAGEAPAGTDDANWTSDSHHNDETSVTVNQSAAEEVTLPKEFNEPEFDLFGTPSLCVYKNETVIGPLFGETSRFARLELKRRRLKSSAIAEEWFNLLSIHTDSSPTWLMKLVRDPGGGRMINENRRYAQLEGSKALGIGPSQRQRNIDTTSLVTNPRIIVNQNENMHNGEMTSNSSAMTELYGNVAGHMLETHRQQYELAQDALNGDNKVLQ